MPQQEQAIFKQVRTCEVALSHVQGKSRLAPLLIGPACESDLKVNGVSARCLVDTGSQVSTVSHSFYKEHLADVPFHDMQQVLQIEVAGGAHLPYLGLIQVDLSFKKCVLGITDSIPALFLVVADTVYNSNVPILVGTNVLRSPTFAPLLWSTL